MVSLLALLALVPSHLGSDFAQPKRESRKQAQVGAEKTSLLRILRRSYIALLVGPFSGAAAVLVLAMIFDRLHIAGLEVGANVVWAMFAFPLGWVLYAVWAVIDQSLLRRTIGILGSILVSSLYLHLGG